MWAEIGTEIARSLITNYRGIIVSQRGRLTTIENLAMEIRRYYEHRMTTMGPPALQGQNFIVSRGTIYKALTLIILH